MISKDDRLVIRLTRREIHMVFEALRLVGLIRKMVYENTNDKHFTLVQTITDQLKSEDMKVNK